MDYTALPGGAAKAFVDAIDFVATVARDAARGVVDVLGDIDRFAQGQVTIRLDFDVNSRVSAFSGPIPRGWGPDAAREAGLRGVRVELHQYAQSLYELGIPLPTSFHASADRDGAVNLRVAKGGGPDGAISLLGTSGICVDMENNAGRVTDFLLATTICDFHSLNVTAIAGGGAPAAGVSLFGNFQHDTDAVITTNHMDMEVMAEASNTFDYVRDVVGTRLRQPRILTGSYASGFSFGKDIAWTPCFGFPNLVSDTDFLLTVGLPIVGEITNVLMTSDIVLPRAAHMEKNYGVMSHEYGHFTMCGLMDIYDEHPETAFTALLEDVTFEGAAVNAGDTTRVFSEAFADFIAGQVTGGANYLQLNSATRAGPDMRFCNGTSAQCWDENRFTEGSGLQSIGRVATLLHDAFDGHARLDLAPSNGDIWSGTSAALTLDTTGYGDANDEEVALGGPRLADFMDDFLFQNVVQSTEADGLPDESFRMGAFETALGEVVKLDYDWCQACDMFLPHVQSTTGLDQVARWEACRDTDRIVHAIGAPPDNDLRIGKATCDLCPPGAVPNPVNGSCVHCPLNEFVSGNKCVACGTGSVPDGAGCRACGAYEVSAGNTCIPCALGKGPDRATNSCADCAVDAVVDWSTALDPACSTVETTQLSSSGDVCPDQFWVEAVNLNGTSSDGRSSDFTFQVRLADDIADPAQCGATTAQGVLAEVSGSGLTSLSSVPPTAGLSCEPSPFIFCGEGLCVPPVDLGLTLAEVSAGRTSVRIMGSALGSNGSVPVVVSIGTKSCTDGGPLH